MITPEIIKQAKQNIDERRAKNLGLHNDKLFHLGSFLLGYTVSLVIYSVILLIFFIS